MRRHFHQLERPVPDVADQHPDQVASDTRDAFNAARLRYALSQPITTAVRGWTKMEHLEADLAVARDFEPMNSEELRSLLTVAEAEAGDGRHEQFKSTRRFDNPIYREMHGLPVEGDQL